MILLTCVGPQQGGNKAKCCLVFLMKCLRAWLSRDKRISGVVFLCTSFKNFKYVPDLKGGSIYDQKKKSPPVLESEQKAKFDVWILFG